MSQRDRARRAPRRVLQLLGLLLLASLASLLLLTSAQAQITPEEGTATPEPDTDVLMRMEVDQPAEPLEEGQEFAARVMLDNVEHMAAFDFTIGFDPDKVSFERVEDQGELLKTGQRQEIDCPDLGTAEDSVSVNCITFGPPVCLGGDAGASGSGLLGTVFFTSKGSGDATLELTMTTLALDDLQPCDETGQAQAIPHRRGDKVTVALAGGGGSSMVLIGGIIGAVAVVVVLGAGGFLWYRRRSAA